MAIVSAARNEPDGEIRTIVAPITHEPPDDPAASIEIPGDVAASPGLDGQRHWLRRANRLQVGFEKTFLEADFFEYDLAAGAFVAAERAFPVSQYAPPADPQTRARAILPMPQPEARQ